MYNGMQIKVYCAHQPQLPQGHKYMSVPGRIFLVAAFASVATSTVARDVVPAETGFNGFIGLGYSYNSIENNEIAGLALGSYDEFTHESIDSIFSSPDGTTEGLPTMKFKFSYTLESRTEFYFGQDLIDAATFDFTNQLGVRQELGDKSNVSVGYVFSGIPTKVWEDPFVENQPRAKSDRESAGARIAYNSIFGSNFDLQYTYRKIDIDTERSGQWLDLTPAQTKLLERDGDQHNVRFGYAIDLGGNDSLYPELVYVKDDRDGDAVSSDQWGLQLTYANVSERFNLALTGNYSSSDYDKTHPIYGKTRDDDNWGVGVALFDKTLLRMLGKNWWATASGGYYKTDSNIDFYDSELWSLGLGVMYRL
jgi:hypothetical protein